MLGHGRDELMHANLTNVVAETDRQHVEDALGQLERREIMRWQSDVQLDGAAETHIPVSLVIASVSDHHPSEPFLLVHANDISARMRLDCLTETHVSVWREIATS